MTSLVTVCAISIFIELDDTTDQIRKYFIVLKINTMALACLCTTICRSGGTYSLTGTSLDEGEKSLSAGKRNVWRE